MSVLNHFRADAMKFVAVLILAVGVTCSWGQTTRFVPANPADVVEYACHYGSNLHF